MPPRRCALNTRPSKVTSAGSNVLVNKAGITDAADELRGTSIKVNSADPGFTATDLNGTSRGYQTVGQGAAEAIRLALLQADGPTGRFFNAQGENPW